MTERQESFSAQDEEITPQEGPAVEELEPQDTVPSAAAHSATETLTDVKTSRITGTSRVLDSMRNDAISIKTLSPNGHLNFEKVQELAAIIPAEVLYQIEDIRPGSLLELFTEKSSENAYLFTFADSQGRINNDAEASIGLNFFFKHRPDVRRLKSISPEGKEEIGDRGNSLRGSFFEKDEYVEVMSGYYVEILEVLEENSPRMKQIQRKQEKARKVFETVQSEPGRFTAFTEMLGSEKYADIETSNISGETQAERLTKRIVERAADSGVDPYLVMSLLKAENGDEGKFFGVMLGEATANFEAQLDWAIKLIQHRERAFKENKGNLYRNNHYSEEFLIYFSETYSPPDENPHHFDNLYKNYALYSNFEPIPTKRLERKREKAHKTTTRKRPKGSPDDKKWTIDDVIPDEAYRKELQSYLLQFTGGERVAEAARILADKSHPHYKPGPWNTASTCWNWANKVYAVSGFHWFERGHKKGRFHYRHPNKVLRGHASRSQLESLQPGDWVYLHVYPVTGGGGDLGDHSLIFLGWEDKENLIAEFADEPKISGIHHARIKSRRLAASGETPIGKANGQNYYPLVKSSSPGKKCDY